MIKDNWLEELNEAQYAAVTYSAGPHLVIAGAGSGKTRVLTYKIAWLIANGVPSHHILALTFTNKAAREMRNRILHLIGNQGAYSLTAGTFHSVFSRILRQEASLLGYTRDFTIYDTSDSKSLVKKLIKEMQLDEKIYKSSLVLNRISEAKNMLKTAADYGHDSNCRLRDNYDRVYRMDEIYQVYQNRLQAANAMDFDDLLFNMYRLLNEFPNKREKYRNLFKYVLVDEYQDTNYAQYKIISLLCSQKEDGFVCVVGDDAQSIYGFRGADIRNILQFQNEYEGSRLFKLERNYRSTKNIVGAANSLIKKNIHQIPKEVYSERGEGLPIMVHSYSTDRDEAAAVVKFINEDKKQGRSLDDIAVLYRTNAQSRVIEDELRKQGVPYRIYGSVSFYQRKEVKDVIAYFRLISNPRDTESLLRIVNFPSRKIGNTTMDKVMLCAAEQGVVPFDVVCSPQQYGLPVNSPTADRLYNFGAMIRSFAQSLETEDAYTFASNIIEKIKLRHYYLFDATAEERDKWENVEELMSALREFVVLRTQANEDTGIRAFLAEVALLTDQDEKQDEKERVTLMTIHAAKGLEFGSVIIVGMEEELFPSAQCMESERDIEEERRLFYVALTRAKEVCRLTSAVIRFRNGMQNFQEPSRFLKDIDSRFLIKQTVSHPSSRLFSSNIDWGDAPSFKPQHLSPIKADNLSEREQITPPFPVGSRVRHKSFGDGTLVDAYKENGTDRVVVEFDNAGKKTMLLKFAVLQKI